ncbi:MAG: amino acid permease [candidate division KSB1 bacterium]|nr:amino acid permease [candidate division KSB1 bacterium]MDZ7272665.1 amino acid permease [candidate division KSB1 bacterium]MDZ7284313.1 amino acid permease [candidate division KSB1 bacterium]MDZ7297291.1 amino acid permease [candidate division KSB1 bacterium]MDZ7309632.1 amino acid permease [candidate division KSB1 bacterium]
MNLFRTKNLDQLTHDAEATRMKRSLGAVDLISLGIGAIIGTGIFAIIGTAVAGDTVRPGAGPAIMLSFVLTAIACAFSGLCYAEFASLVPVSGSAYTYAYATLGELVAWIIGWDLIIEYAIGNVAVAIGWAAYFHQMCEGLGLHIPAWLSVDYRSAAQTAAAVAKAGGQVDPSLALNYEAWLNHPTILGIPIIFNFLAVAIVALITWVLVLGAKESAWVNNLMVAIKLAILLFFIYVGAKYVKPEHWSPFMPNGFPGVWTGASLIFFAYIGFDAISTAAEECRNPGRDMPIGIIGSLAICTLLYVAVAAVLTGMMPWDKLGVADPLAEALAYVGSDAAAGLVAFGAVISMTAVLLVFQYGQPRIFFAMSRDGLLPPYFEKIHPKYKTPHKTTIWTGVVVATIAAVANINEIVELTNIGTLFAFVLVCAGVIILRYKDPHRPRVFKTPLVPLVPLLGIASCVYLMAGLPHVTWLRFGVWLLAGLLLYFVYGFWHSQLRGKA